MWFRRANPCIRDERSLLERTHPSVRLILVAGFFSDVPNVFL